MVIIINCEALAVGSVAEEERDRETWFWIRRCCAYQGWVDSLHCIVI